MEEKKESTKSTVAQQVNSVPLTEVLFMTLRKWPWLLLSLVVCMSIAVIYVLRTPLVYSRAAEIMIKEDKRGRSIGPDEFSDFGLFKSRTNLQNEIATLKSKDLMTDVVNRLNLDINYFSPGRFHKDVAYGYTLPVQVQFLDFPSDNWCTFDLNVDKNGQVKLSDFNIQGEKVSKVYTGNMRDTIMTPAGKLLVRPTNFYQKDSNVTLFVNKIPVSSAASRYVGKLAVSLANEDGTVIRLVISDQSVQRADDVLSTLIGVYNESWIRDKNQIAVSTSNFINERLNVIEGELGKVDNDISSYKSANLIPDVQAVSSMYLSENQKIAGELNDLNNQLQMTRYVRSYLTADNNQDQLLPSNSGITDADIQGQIIAYNNKILERNTLIAKSSEKNPLVQTIDRQLDQMRSAIISTVDNQIIALNTQIKNMQRSEAQATSRIASNPTQAKYLLSVERQQKVKESLYIYLLQKREENELSQAFTAYNTRIVNKPGPSGAPTLPNRRNIYTMAFIIGLVIPFGIIYLLELTNTRLRGRKDVENLTLPFLGEIPQDGPNAKKQIRAKGEEKDQTNLIVEPHNRNVMNEAFRVLRTNVEFMTTDKEHATVIAVTSFNPHSGKSFITVNLGATLALKRKRVLVIDGDMRHGSTSAYIGRPENGMSNYLSGAVQDLNSIIVEDPNLPGFYILPIGTIPPNPTELLESPRFEKMIEQLRGEFDYILIDCPPIEIVADAQIIDKFVDRTIFILRAGLLERSMLPELEKLNNEKKYKNMAFILNGTVSSHGRYSSRYGYRYGYGYGRGYGYYGHYYSQDDNKSRKSKKK